MNTERVLRTATGELSQEDHLSAGLPHTYVIVLYAVEILLHLVQLMVVCGEEHACPCPRIFVHILHYCPRYAYAVVCGSAASQLVEEHERARRHVVQYV